MIELIMENNVLVSILVPIYGVAKYIGRCATSIFEQTYRNIEYIFVDDCTYDDSVNILLRVMEEYPDRAPYVRIIRHECNMGLAAARNSAVSAATGDYLMHVDGDDYIENDAVYVLLKKAKECNADIVVSDYFLEYKHRSITMHNNIPCEKDVYIRQLLTKCVPPSIWGKLYSTHLYKKNGINAVVGINHGEDYVTLPRLVYYARKITHIRAPLYHYIRYNDNAYTKNLSKKSISQMLRADKVLEDFFSKVNDSGKYTETIILSKLRTKVNLLKRGNKDLFEEISSLYPELTVKYKYMLSYKDRVLLTLIDKHLYNIVCIYIYLGLFLSRLK